MTPEQLQTVELVYRRFAESENERPGWNPIDEAMEKLSYLDIDQLVRESRVLLEEHKQGKVKCNLCVTTKHANSVCFAPKILESVRIILDDCEKYGKLNTDYIYMLQYYLTLHHVKVIFVEQKQLPKA